MGVYRRGDKLWLRYKDAEGKWRDRSSGYTVGEESKAREMYDELVRLVRPAQVATATGGRSGALTVAAYSVPWLRERAERGLDWTVDASRLKHHVLPYIGDMELASVRAKHLIAMFHELRTKPRTGRALAPRTIHHVYATTRALFGDAKRADLIAQTPAELDERDLGVLKDRDPEWRAGAKLARDEVESLITDARVPPDRQMTYGLEFLAGLRTGEAAALRWRHYDAAMRPLGRLLVARSYNTRRNAEKGTKTDVTKHVPVHPVLAAMLAEWKLGGWAAMMGRAPGPDDLIVPMPQEHAARRRRRHGEAFRPNYYAGKRWGEDCAALGFRHRRHYDTRSTFITLAIEDGADPEILERYVTHSRRETSAFAGYYRPDVGATWERTCAEVAKLRISRGPRQVGAVATAIPNGSAADSLHDTASLKNHGSFLTPISVAASDPILLAVAHGTSRWRRATVSRLPRPIRRSGTASGTMRRTHRKRASA